MKGAPSDHTFTWSNANDAWQSSEDMELVNGKTYNIINGAGNAIPMLSLTQIGDSTSVSGLGAGVTTAGATQFSFLNNLNVGTTVAHTGARILADGNIKMTQATDNTRRIFSLNGK